jgi:hypothetical protein
METLCRPNRPNVWQCHTGGAKQNNRFPHALTFRPLTLLSLCSLVMLSGCAYFPAGWQPGASHLGEAMPVFEGGPWVNTRATEKEILLGRSDFSVELVRFTDNRRPRSSEFGPGETRFYIYEPDKILGGVDVRIPALIEKYLTYRPRRDKNYLVEIDLTELRMEVLRGNFISGSNGRYSIEMRMIATARRPDSTVILRRGYKVIDTNPRKTYNGRSPSVEMDRAQLDTLAEAAVRKMAEHIGWDIRQNDARRWDIGTPSPESRFQLSPKPELNRAAGSTSAYGSELIQAPTPEPNMQVPALPQPPSYAPDSTPVEDVPDDAERV